MKHRVINEERAVEVCFGKDAAVNSYQEPFKTSIECAPCGGVAQLTFSLAELGGPTYGGKERKYLCHAPNQPLHDCAAFAVYLCECGHATTLWNQA